MAAPTPTPTHTPTRPILDTMEKRFWARVDKHGPVPPARPDLGPCWLWTGSTSSGGRYGRIRVSGGRSSQVHVVSYQWAGGVVPSEWDVDHLCHTTLCVRPEHLEAVTHRENVRRGLGWAGTKARQTHCSNGHPFDEANTRFSATGRVCRACGIDAARRQRERIKADPDLYARQVEARRQEGKAPS